ncbi:MAG: hypothetical protein K2P63_15170, partial [Lachnospiraceae bacterium]|nr:hypothetical protein [Lachnospiraceae bacterium]
FGDGPYVMKAMELKAKHVPLTSIQQKNYGIMLGNSRQNYSAQSYDAGDGSAQDYGNDTYDPGQNYAAEGYGDQGYGTAGYDSQNYSSEKYDSPNYGEAGYAGQNREEAGYGEQNYGGGSYAGENYGTTGYGDQNYNSENYETSAYGGQNYDSENYAASGYSDQNYNNENYEASGYDSQNYNNENYGTSGYGDQNYNSENYEASGYGGQNYTNENYEASGYDGQNYNRERYEASNYGGQNYNDENYEASGYGSQSYNNENYEASGYGGQNYAGESYDTQNYKASGYGSENYNGQNEPAPDGDGYGSYGQNNFVDDGYGNLSYVDNSYRDGGFTGEFYVEQAYDENGNLISPELYADDADGAQERYDYVQDNSAQGAVGSGSTSREYRNGLRLVENTAPAAGTSSDMSQYNTINLQKVVAESMKELFPDEDGDVFAEDREKYNAGAKLDNTAGDTRIFGSLAGYGVKDSRGPKATLAQNSQGGADALREELTQTGKVAQMVTGVSEKAPAPHTGAIRKVLVPGDDARLIKSDSNIDELRDTTEKSVDDEHIRMEYNDENVYHDQNLTDADAAVQSQTTGSMDLGEVLVAWQRMKQDSARKNQEEIKQRVQSQTGRIFIDFDNSIKSGILGELEREEAQAKRDSQAENSARKRKTARDGFLDADITSDIPQTPTAEDDFDVAYTTEQSRPAAAQAAVQPASDTVHRPGPTDAGVRAQGTRAVRADNAGNERVETDMYPVDEAVTKTQDTTAQEYLADAVEMGFAEDTEDVAEAQADLYTDLYIEELGAEQTDGRGLDEDSAAAHLQEETAVYENALHRTQENADLAAGAESTTERARAVDDLQELSDEEENPNPHATESGKEINCPQDPALSEGYGEGAGDENARNYPQESASSEGYDEEAGYENARNYIQE